MAIHLEQSTHGFMALPEHEPPDVAFAPAAPEPGLDWAAVPVVALAFDSAEPAPVIAPDTTPHAWVQNLPGAAFGPPSPHTGQPMGPNALAELLPPPALVITETGAAPVANTVSAGDAVAPATAPATAPASPPVTAPASTPSTAASAPTAPAMEIAMLELTLADPPTR